MHSDRSKWMGHFSNVEQGWGFWILQMFQIQKNSDLPPENCENKSPVTRSSHRKREKWPMSGRPTLSLSYQYVRQSGKVCTARLTLCYMFFMFFVCVINMLGSLFCCILSCRLLMYNRLCVVKVSLKISFLILVCVHVCVCVCVCKRE